MNRDEPTATSDARLEFPSLAQLDRLARSSNPLDTALFELWRGRSGLSSVKAARLTREQADAILIALDEVVDG